MTTQPGHDDVQRIAAVRAPWCVTVYGGVDSWLRGNHANGSAEAQIRAAADGLRMSGAPDEVIRAIHTLLDQVATPQAQVPGEMDRRARSIGIFATENGAEIFGLISSPTPWVGVADRFLVAPLLHGALSLHPSAFVLAISENEVRLVDVTSHPAEAVDVPDIPHDLKSTIALDLAGDREALSHLRTSEDPKVRLREYSRAIDRVIEPVLRREGAVLVIAAAEPLASIYRLTTRHGNITSSDVAGNHDGDTADELANLAAPIMARHRREALEAHLARFAEMPARDRILTDLDEIAAAARDRTIDTLFVDTDRRLPTSAEAFGRAIMLDRVDEIVRNALSGGVTIVPVQSADLPTSDPVSAVLRYADATRSFAAGR